MVKAMTYGANTWNTGSWRWEAALRSTRWMKSFLPYSKLDRVLKCLCTTSCFGGDVLFLELLNHWVISVVGVLSTALLVMIAFSMAMLLLPFSLIGVI